MKKLLTIAALIGATTSLSFGQGQVTFANSGTTLISTNQAHNGSSTGVTSPYSGSVQYIYALFVAPSTVNSVSGVNDANWQTLVGYATNTTSATGGRLAGGQPVVPGFLTGTTANFVIRAWSSNVAGLDWTTARTWESVYETTGFAPTSGGYWFSSGVEQIAVGGTPNPVTATFGATPGTSFQGFTLDLRPVPEPSTFALAGLGAAAMLIFRRRKE